MTDRQPRDGGLRRCNSAAAADRERTGTFAATINAIRQTGVGVALLGTLIASQVAHLGDRSFEQAYTDGLHLVAVVSGTVTASAAFLVLFTMRRAASPSSGLTRSRRRRRKPPLGPEAPVVPGIR